MPYHLKFASTPTTSQFELLYTSHFWLCHSACPRTSPRSRTSHLCCPLCFPFRFFFLLSHHVLSESHENVTAVQEEAPFDASPGVSVAMKLCLCCMFRILCFLPLSISDGVLKQSTQNTEGWIPNAHSREEVSEPLSQPWQKEDLMF